MSRRFDLEHMVILLEELKELFQRNEGFDTHSMNVIDGLLNFVRSRQLEPNNNKENSNEH